MWRFIKNLVKHPGTWTFLSLLSIGIAIAVPPVAPILVPVAAGCISAAALTSLFTPFTFNGFWKKLTTAPETLVHFFSNHPVQAFLVVLAAALLITTLVLTIGFFTGGMGFMAPVFAMLAAPFASAAAAAGLQLCLAALAGATLVIASLNIPNTLKRFVAWLDSFTRDAAVMDDALVTKYTNWTTDARTITDGLTDRDGYWPTVFQGIKANVTNNFSSPDADRLKMEEKAKDDTTVSLI